MWGSRKKFLKKALWQGNNEPQVEKYLLKLWLYCRVLKAERKLTSSAKIEFGGGFQLKEKPQTQLSEKIFWLA